MTPTPPTSTTSPLPHLDDHLRRIAEDGYTILPNAIEPAFVDEIDDALLKLEHDLGTVPAENLFEGLHTTRVYNLLVHGPTFQKIPVHPNVLPVVEGVLDPGLLISSLSSIAIGPDEQAQPIHADDQLIPLQRPHAPIICNTMWAITDFTEENGATRLVPASHLRDEPPNPLERYDDTIAAEMAKGSVLVWVGSVWHGGGANRTDHRRVGIAMNYCAGFIRQQENQQLGVPPALARTFPRRLQELMGYSVYNGLIGHIDKKHPAKIVLAENEGVDMVWDLLEGLISSGRSDLRPSLAAYAAGATGGATGHTQSRGSSGTRPSAAAPAIASLHPLSVAMDLGAVQGRGISVAEAAAAVGHGVEDLDRRDGVDTRVVRALYVRAVVIAQRAEGPAPLACIVVMTIQHGGVQHRPAPPPPHDAVAQESLSLHPQHGQVEIQLHPEQREPALTGRQDRVRHQGHRLVQWHALLPRPVARDAVDRGRLLGDVPAGIDEAGSGYADPTPHRVHERVGDRHVVESVDARRLQVQPQQLAGRPCTHATTSHRGVTWPRTSPRVTVTSQRPGTRPPTASTYPEAKRQGGPVTDMKAVQVTRHGAPGEVLEVRTVERPEPGPNEVRVRVHAASLNFNDIDRCRGNLVSVPAPPPFTLGMDVCGVVDAVGEGAEAWLGQRAVAITKNALGGIAEYAIADAISVFDAPPSFDDTESAAFLLPFQTSHLALFRRGRLQRGETLVVHSPASGLGTAGIQLAKATGARVIAVAGGAEKAALCASLGADLVVDHTSEDFVEAVLGATGDAGADVVYDLTGGDFVERSWRCTAHGGRYLAVGFADDDANGMTGRPLRMACIGNIDIVAVMLAWVDSVDPGMRRFGFNPFGRDVADAIHGDLLRLAAAGMIRPVVGRRVTMADAGRALDEHEARRSLGRTVVEVVPSGEADRAT